jgi:hypothetical protein
MLLDGDSIGDLCDLDTGTEMQMFDAFTSVDALPWQSAVGWATAETC